MHNIDITSVKRFFNRELSWLSFNSRVLKEAENKGYPLLERLRFLEISASNLIEFYMVRYASLKARIKVGINLKSDDGKTPLKQIKIIRKKTLQLHEKQAKYLKKIKKELKKNNVEIASLTSLNEAEQKYLKKIFKKNILPFVSLFKLDEASSFPLLLNGQNTLLLEFEKENGKSERAIIPFPLNMPRFVKLSSDKKDKFISLEDVIYLCAGEVFNLPKIANYGLFCLVRDSIIDVDERADDLVKGFEIALERRKRGQIACLLVADNLPLDLVSFISDKLFVAKEDVLRLKGLVDLRGLKDIYLPKRKELYFKPHRPLKRKKLKELKGNFFEVLTKKDVCFYHPYESFDAVQYFLEEAAENPDVMAIKQTLYRTNKNSPIIEALIKAAKNGKKVTAVIELRARFDEEANLKWARSLEKAGVKVCFGLPDFKTHAKMSLVVLKKSGKTKSFVHFGTGNYNPETAKSYTDISLFTSDKQICRDALKMFDYLLGKGLPKVGFEKIFVSPFNLRKKIIFLIEKEIQNARKGKPANIWIKVNALSDKDIIDALYRASQAGVNIRLIVRGICSLRPELKGLSDNIKVKSIVGRFLEHARIYCFGNGNKLPSKKAKIFISSADLMYRNLSERIESFIPIDDEKIHRRIMQTILQKQMKDKCFSWSLDAKMNYKRLSKEKP